jgi:hypothetical protein
MTDNTRRPDESQGTEDKVPQSTVTSLPSTAGDVPKERRFVFVQLLFSLAIAEVVRQLADLHGSNWIDVLPAYLHLVLGALVIATSWMGWSTAAAVKELRADKVFGWPFVFLLVDLTLLAFYFILVRSVERPDAQGQFEASPLTELRWVAVILVGYVVWDVLTLTLITKQREEPFTSLGAAVYAVGLFFFLRDVTSYWNVVLVDVALITLILAYRAAKERKRACTVAIGVASVAAAIGARYYG